MAKRLSQHATQANTNAAAVATAMAGGHTTAELQGMAEVMKVLSMRPDLAATVIKLCDQTKTLPEFG